MESSGVVTNIRETRIPNVSAFEGRKKIRTPDLAELPCSRPKTREEVIKFQLDAIELVAPKLKEGLSWSEARDLDGAVEAARTVRGVWPKAELLARLKNQDLFSKALQLFDEVEAFRAVA